MLLILFEAMDYSAFGPLMAQIRDEFRLTATQLGLYSGLGSLFAVLTAIPVGELIRRRGYRISGTGLALAVVVGSVISFYAASFIALVAGRVILTTGTRGCQLVGQAGGTTVAPKAFRSTAWACLNSMISIGGGLGSVFLGGYVGAHHGWRCVMPVMVVTTLAAIFVYAWLLRMPSVSVGEGTEAATEEPNASAPVNIYKVWGIYLLGVTFILVLAGLIVNATFAAVIAQDRWNLDAQFTGNATGLGNSLSVPLLFVAAAIADRVHSRKRVLSVLIVMGIVGPLLEVASLAMEVAEGGPTLFTIGIILCYVSGVVGGALIFAAAPELVETGTNLGPVYGLLSVVSMSGWFLEPIMGGMIRDATGSFRPLLMTFGLSGLGALFLLQMLRIR